MLFLLRCRPDFYFFSERICHLPNGNLYVIFSESTAHLCTTMYTFAPILVVKDHLKFTHSLISIDLLFFFSNAFGWMYFFGFVTDCTILIRKLIINVSKNDLDVEIKRTNKQRQYTRWRTVWYSIQVTTNNLTILCYCWMVRYSFKLPIHLQSHMYNELVGRVTRYKHVYKTFPCMLRQIAHAYKCMFAWHFQYAAV